MKNIFSLLLPTSNKLIIKKNPKEFLGIRKHFCERLKIDGIFIIRHLHFRKLQMCREEI